MTDPDHDHLSIDEANELLARLEAKEADLSARRTRLHDRIDFVRQTVGNDRIAAGRLEVLLADERRLAGERRGLHSQIDELIAARRVAR
jgi:RsiG-like